MKYLKNWMVEDNMADIIGAINLIKHGEKIRRTSWDKSSYLHLREDEIVNNKGGKVKFCNINSFNADDWEIFKEEKSDNPMDYCMNCDKYLGFRGFCCTKCHDEYNEHDFDIKKEENLSGKIEDLLCPKCKNLAFTNRIHSEYVKESIKKVKKEIKDSWGHFNCVNGDNEIFKIIDKHFGDKLTCKKKH